MKITIVGAGYVGLVTGACFAEAGNEVTFLDVNAERVDALHRGRKVIEEPGLHELLAKNYVHATVGPIAALKDADVIFVCVPTPSNPDGSANLDYLWAAVETIDAHAPAEAVVVVKSTVPPRTTERVLDRLGNGRHVAMNPEFLAEGRAVKDFQRPDRVVIGTSSETARRVLGVLYAPFVRSGKPIIFMDSTSAEISKLAANVMLATRISMMNEIALVCDDHGGDIESVRKAVGADARIGPNFLYAGVGFGGSCFTKDLRDFEHVLMTKKSRGFSITSAVLARNNTQRGLVAERAIALATQALPGADGSPSRKPRLPCVAIWGIAFKPDTDDIRDSPAMDVAARIRSEFSTDVHVIMHDPSEGARAHAMASGRDGIAVSSDRYQAVEGCEGSPRPSVLVLMTEWMEYRSPDWKRIAASGIVSVIDGRNIWDSATVRAAGLHYEGIGRR